ncbi:MAG: YggS family pyridoxal phosphate-dependent enzyme [Chloroflexota bacterium]|nr:YggS family pyridoxal phosphate-dependent enzyme [Chloroflexota bacterium]
MNANTAYIADAVQEIKSQLPPDVILIAAAKTRSLEEVEAVIEAGVTHIGYNYLQEALPIIEVVGDRVQWHMIGHLQTNKAKLVAAYFDMCQTIDSWHLAKYLDHRCELVGRTLPVLIEINSGEESNKTGVMPEDVDALAEQVSSLKHLKLQGIMTMGPRFGEPEESRPYFKLTRKAFERVKALALPNVEMTYLSMGMSNSYPIAIEEGANMIRVGTKLFGERA